MSNKTTFIRVEKNTNYSVIHNEFLRRKDLSWKAKGILAYILHLPNSWNINLSEIMTHSTEGKAAFNTGWKELEKAGYVKRQPVREGSRIAYWETIVRENVDVEPSSLLTDFQEVENLEVENRTLLSTNNTKYLNKVNTNSPAEAEQGIPNQEIVAYLNEQTGKNYKHTTKKTKDLIKARWNEGYGVDDFKKVIDVKADDWLNDKEMVRYLRPETLFGTKFEAYLNQFSEPQIQEVKNVSAENLKAIESMLGE